MDRAAVHAGLQADAAALVASLGSLRPTDFARATPCAAWDVRHLVAHLYRDFERIPEALAATTTDPADLDWVSYWRYDRTENQAQTQARATTIAARFRSGPALVESLRRLLERSLTQAATAPATNTRLPWGPVIAFDDLLRTRWVELAVHSLDLADALGRPPWVSPAGLCSVVETLDALAAPQRAGAGRVETWSALDLIRAATGRRPLTAEERASLGADLADRFPLLT